MKKIFLFPCFLAFTSFSQVRDVRQPYVTVTPTQIREASQSEINMGSVSGKYVSPLSLRNWSGVNPTSLGYQLPFKYSTVTNIEPVYDLLNRPSDVSFFVREGDLASTLRYVAGNYYWYSNVPSLKMQIWTNGDAHSYSGPNLGTPSPWLIQYSDHSIQESPWTTTPNPFTWVINTNGFSANMDNYHFIRYGSPISRPNADAAGQRMITWSAEGGCLPQGVIPGNETSYVRYYNDIYLITNIRTAPLVLTYLPQSFFQEVRDQLKSFYDYFLTINTFTFTNGILTGKTALGAGLSPRTYLGDSLESMFACRDAFSFSSISNVMSVYAGDVVPGFTVINDEIFPNSGRGGPVTTNICGEALGFIHGIYLLWQTSYATNIWKSFGSQITNAFNSMSLTQSLIFTKATFRDDAMANSFFDGQDIYGLGSVFRYRALLESAEMALGAGSTDYVWLLNEAATLKANYARFLWDNTYGLYRAGTNTTHNGLHDIVGSAMAVRYGCCFSTNALIIQQNFVTNFFNPNYWDNKGNSYYYPSNEIGAVSWNFNHNMREPWTWWADDIGFVLEQTRPDLARLWWKGLTAGFITEWAQDFHDDPSTAFYSVNFMRPYNFIRERAGDFGIQYTSYTPLIPVAKADRPPAPAIGTAVYQIDNTPGLRVWNGTSWMRFTETAD